MTLRITADPSTICLLLICGWAAQLDAQSPSGNKLQPPGFAAVASGLRRPADLVYLDAGRCVVANGNGTLSLLDTKLNRVVAEVRIGKKLSDMALLADGCLAVSDEVRHELILVRYDSAANSLRVIRRIAVSPYPVDVIADQRSNSCFVTSLWSRRVTRVSWKDSAGMVDDSLLAKPEVTTVDLPFPPREQLLLTTADRLLVADGFGGKFALIGRRDMRLHGTREIPAHNIRGLTLDQTGTKLLIAQQMLNELARTVRNDVHWGLLVSNDIRWLSLDAFLDGKDVFRDAHMQPLGEAGNAAGDPVGLAVTRDGTLAAGFGGVNEVGIARSGSFTFSRIAVGHRPVALALSPTEKQLAVANQLNDSITVIRMSDLNAVQIALGKPLAASLVTGSLVTGSLVTGSLVTGSLADDGERLFYNARISHDGWMSCHSCHTDGHTTGMLADNLSDSDFGASKRILSLLGKADTAPFAWNGQAATLEQQIDNSIRKTMLSKREPTKYEISALAAFVRSLAPPPSIDDARGTTVPADIAAGKQVFAKLGCVDCHAPPRYTTPDSYDVGIHDKRGRKQFNPPSLLGVGQSGPYFHDNRAAKLSDVIDKFKHQLPRALRDDEQRRLLAFLRSL